MNEEDAIRYANEHISNGGTLEEANVMLVRYERFRIVSRLPREIRNALNAAVKRGELGHMKKDGPKPEVYYHPDFKYLAVEERNRAVRRSIDALSKVCAPRRIEQ